MGAWLLRDFNSTVHILLQQEGAFPVEVRLVREIEEVYLNIIASIINVGFTLTKDHMRDVQQCPTSDYIRETNQGTSFGRDAGIGIPFGETRSMPYPFRSR